MSGTPLICKVGRGRQALVGVYNKEELVECGNPRQLITKVSGNRDWLEDVMNSEVRPDGDETLGPTTSMYSTHSRHASPYIDW